MASPTWRRRLGNWFAARDTLGLKLGLLSLAAFLPGFTWGLPHATHSATVRGWAIDSVAGISTLAELHNLFVSSSADWYVAYPVLHYLVLAALSAPYLLFLKLTGGFGNPSGEFPFGFSDPEAALAMLSGIGQALSLLMAAGTVACAYYIARSLGNRTAGIVAALVVMLAGPMIFYSKTSNLDVPVLFWIAAGLLAGVHALKHGMSVRLAASLGLLAAVSVATKDQAYGLWIPALVYLAVHHLRASGGGTAAWKPVAALVGSGALGYAVLSGLLFWPGRFFQHLSYLRHFDQNFFNVLNPTGITVMRPATASGYLALVGDMLAAVSEAIGPVSLVVGVAGLMVLTRKSPGARFLALALIGYVALTILPVRHMQYRYTMFPAFVLAIGAGTAVARLVAARGTALRPAGALLLGAAVVTLGYRAVDLSWQMVKDARYAAGAWLDAAARPGDRIAFFGAFHQLPRLPSGVEPLQLESDSLLRVGGAGRIRFVYVAADYFSDSLHQRSSFLPETVYRQLGDGTLGYKLAGRFETRPLRSSWLRHFPYVNPPVQVFESVAP